MVVMVGVSKANRVEIEDELIEWSMYLPSRSTRVPDPIDRVNTLDDAFISITCHRPVNVSESRSNRNNPPLRLKLDDPQSLRSSSLAQSTPLKEGQDLVKFWVKQKEIQC